MKKEKKKLSLDDLEIESFETKMVQVVAGTAATSSSILSCAHSSCPRGGPC